MAKGYAAEISNLSKTFTWVKKCDIEPLQQGLSTAGLFPLCAVGSGGSLTVCHALASLHQRHAGQVAAALTPLEALAELTSTNVATWILSAGGSNVDVLHATRQLIQREPRQIAVLCGREDSPLARLCRTYPFVDLFIYPPPCGKDGFLATNSAFGFTALLARASAVNFNRELEWKVAVDELKPLLNDESEELAKWKQAVDVLWARPTTLVLHGPSTRIGAIDLESKFTEAALGHLQVADYRNFAHGRRNWLAKRGATSAVLAFVTKQDESLANRTLELIPSEIPKARIELSNDWNNAMLTALLAALHIAGWAGSVRGIELARPNVPQFGRKLYNLPLKSSLQRSVGTGLSIRDAASITRKAGTSTEQLAMIGELNYWKQALYRFRNRIKSTAFAGIVFDYDGTIVDTRHRYDKPTDTVVSELIRISESGAWLAFATGRGVSVRRDLRACIPDELFPRILVGYYNGADIALLENDNAPNGADITCDALSPIAVALRAHPELASGAEQTDRCFQITLVAKRVMPMGRLWELVNHVVHTTSANVTVTCSSHSVDVLAPNVSKRSVVNWLHGDVQDLPLLTIGDRGRWPGNDFDLLQENFSLSVGEVSVDASTCWNLALPGRLGTVATLEYLTSLESRNGFIQFSKNSLQ